LISVFNGTEYNEYPLIFLYQKDTETNFTFAQTSDANATGRAELTTSSIKNLTKTYSIFMSEQGEMLSSGTLNFTVNVTDPPTGDILSPAGDLRPPDEDLRSPVGDIRPPVGDILPPAEQESASPSKSVLSDVSTVSVFKTPAGKVGAKSRSDVRGPPPRLPEANNSLTNHLDDNQSAISIYPLAGDSLIRESIRERLTTKAPSFLPIEGPLVGRLGDPICVAKTCGL
jgi:hypothetical protein